MENKFCQFCDAKGPIKHKNSCDRKVPELSEKEKSEITTNTTGLPVSVQPKETIDDLVKKIEELERRDKENQDRLALLYSVADKGKVLNYESKKEGKKPMKVYLSNFSGGIIVGWRTIKDKLIKNPTTGLTVGEEQQYELLVEDSGEIKKVLVNSYAAFSEARYGDRVECEVVGKKEDFDGKISFDVSLPNGKIITIDSKFVN